MNFSKSKIALTLITSTLLSSAFAIEVDYWITNESEFSVTLQPKNLDAYAPGTCWQPAVLGNVFNDWIQQNGREVNLKGLEKIKLGKIDYSWSCWQTLSTDLRFNIISQNQNEIREGQCAFNLQVRTKGVAGKGYVEKVDLQNWNTGGCQVNINKLTEGKVEINIPAVFKGFVDIKKQPSCSNNQEITIDEELKPVEISPVCKGGTAIIRLPGTKPGIPGQAYHTLEFSFNKPIYRTSETVSYAISPNNLLHTKNISGTCKYEDTHKHTDPNKPNPCFPSLLVKEDKLAQPGAKPTITIRNTSDFDMLPVFNAGSDK